MATVVEDTGAIPQIVRLRAPWQRRLLQPVVLGAVGVFVVTQVVYLLTLTVTCPFWDSGEFIATSHILGIPHPPGTPLYVLIGRLFALVPIGLVASRVNYLSALASSMAAVFTYLVAIRFFRRWPSASMAPPEDVGQEPTPWPSFQWVSIAVGLTAGFFTAFGRTFWDNAIEAEVYGLSNFVMIFSVWLTLRWADGVRAYRQWKRQGSGGSALEAARTLSHPEMLVLIIYLLFLSIGIHMGTFIVLPGIILFVAISDPSTVFNGRFLSSMGLAGLCVILFFVLLGQGSSVPLALGIALLIYALVIGFAWRMLGERNYAFWFFVLGFLGVTVHLFLYIRANLDPAINEADPSTWDAFWKVLIRDQYKPPNPFVTRQAPFDVQFTKHFWRYAHDQYQLGLVPGTFLKLYLPWFLGLVGAVGHWLREKKGAILMTVLYLSTSLFLIFYLNFRDDEVRDRDYFFVASYHFFAIWIGLGVGELALTVRDALTKGARRVMVGAVAVLGVAASLLTVKAMFFQHDRTDNWVARDYAYNMLGALEPDAILFTNGDNDTFPLWYIQEVEDFRKDVRVVNLSLLQTPWYIKQLRDYEPTVDLQWSDDLIDQLHPFYDKDTGDIVWVNDLAMARIVELYADNRPVYIAVTVPDRRELEARLVMEGLVFSVRPPGDPNRIDVDRTVHNLENVYKYRGLLKEDGSYDDTVYKDDNSRKLVQNYAAAWVRVAHQSIRDGNKERARIALENANRISPSFAGAVYTMGILYYQERDYEQAEEQFREVVENGQGDSQIYRLLGLSQEAQGKMEEAFHSYQQALDKDRDDRDNYLNLVQFLMSAEKPEEALTVLDAWLTKRPDDTLFRDARIVILRTIDSLRQAGKKP